MVWHDLGLNPGHPDHWRTLYPLGQWTAAQLDDDVDVVLNDRDKAYHRKNFKSGKVPAVVLEKDRQVVLVHHGRDYYCIHLCQLMKVKNNSICQIEGRQKGKMKRLHIDGQKKRQLI